MDKATWLEISKGNKEAYSRTYIFFYKRLYNYGRKLTDDIPLLEDTVQEVLMDIWKNREGLPSIGAQSAYYYASFRNALIAKLKRQRKNVVPGSAEEFEFPVEHFIVRREQQEQVQLQLIAALKTLTPRQREAIFLRFYEGFSYEEVAQVMEISVKGAYKIMARALLQLKETLSLPAITLIFLQLFPDLL